MNPLWAQSYRNAMAMKERIMASTPMRLWREYGRPLWAIPIGAADIWISQNKTAATMGVSASLLTTLAVRGRTGLLAYAMPAVAYALGRTAGHFISGRADPRSEKSSNLPSNTPVIPISSKDDTYNIIEALPETGMAGQLRKINTDFGSGYRGDDKLTFGRVMSYINSGLLIGAAGLTGFDRFRIPGAIGGAAIGAGIVFGTEALKPDPAGEKRLWKTLWSGALEGFKLSAFGSMMASSFMRGATLERTLGQKLFGKIAAKRGMTADQFLIARGAEVGIGAEEALAGGMYGTMSRGMRNTMEQFIPGRKGKLIGFAMETQFGSPTMFDLMAKYKVIQKIPAKEYLAGNTKDIFLGTAAGVIASAPLSILTYPFQKKNKPVNPISGRDDDYNTIEGLRHEGMAGQLRKANTPFGSGFDPARAFAKPGETFTAMRASSEFRIALENAKVIKELGEGAFGTATKMRAVFRGKPFEFVRKIGKITGREITALGRLESSIGPSLYSKGVRGGKQFVDIEYFAGETAEDFYQRRAGMGMNPFGTVRQPTPQQAEELRWLAQERTRVLKKMQKAGVLHKDFHLANAIVMQSSKGLKLAPIDLGIVGLAPGIDLPLLKSMTTGQMPAKLHPFLRVPMEGPSLTIPKLPPGFFRGGPVAIGKRVGWAFKEYVSMQRIQWGLMREQGGALLANLLEEVTVARKVIKIPERMAGAIGGVIGAAEHHIKGAVSRVRSNVVANVIKGLGNGPLAKLMRRKLRIPFLSPWSGTPLVRIFKSLFGKQGAKRLARAGSEEVFQTTKQWYQEIGGTIRTDIWGVEVTDTGATMGAVQTQHASGRLGFRLQPEIRMTSDQLALLKKGNVEAQALFIHEASEIEQAMTKLLGRRGASKYYELGSEARQVMLTQAKPGWFAKFPKTPTIYHTRLTEFGYPAAERFYTKQIEQLEQRIIYATTETGQLSTKLQRYLTVPRYGTHMSAGVIEADLMFRAKAGPKVLIEGPLGVRTRYKELEGYRADLQEGMFAEEGFLGPSREAAERYIEGLSSQLKRYEEKMRVSLRFDGLSHKGIAAERRQIFTEFGSGWRGLFSALIHPMRTLRAWRFGRQAARGVGSVLALGSPVVRQAAGSIAFQKQLTQGATLYEKMVRSALEGTELAGATIKTGVEMEGALQQAGAIHLVARMKGKSAVSIYREFSPSKIYLGRIEIAEQIRNQGIGSILRKGEASVFKKIGFSPKTLVEADVVNHRTAYMHLGSYGGEVVPYASQITLEEELYKVGKISEVFAKDPQKFRAAILRKEYNESKYIGARATGTLGYLEQRAEDSRKIGAMIEETLANYPKQELARNRKLKQILLHREATSAPSILNAERRQSHGIARRPRKRLM